jgi:glutamyl-tRNA synthetase
LLHIGHARTFLTAADHARQYDGTLILRNEDLDPQRCRSEFVSAMYEDLKWLGIEWTEGPDCGGPFGPYAQSERRTLYFEGWKKLREGGWIYPCSCSRKDLAAAAAAPNEGDDEPLYPGACRNRPDAGSFDSTLGVNWRFRVPDGQAIEFVDRNLGRQSFVAGIDFGDFVVWRRDDVPAYQLAVTMDDAHMQITEVVRGADLLKSTARQLLLFDALGYAAPDYYRECGWQNGMTQRASGTYGKRALHPSTCWPMRMRLRPDCLIRRASPKTESAPFSRSASECTTATV